MNQKEVGFYGKYYISRVDGRDKSGGDREDSFHYVLDLTHDPHAVAAAKAYADSCREDYPLLARDLDRKIEELHGFGDGILDEESV